mmetsp:Transcript_20833/g.30524  ORF Transcript_20833/g.30524 Transcript_20833/m.30524 type:complete len:163 (-) Transcript_20833:77-565(-)
MVGILPMNYTTSGGRRRKKADAFFIKVIDAIQIQSKNAHTNSYLKTTSAFAVLNITLTPNAIQGKKKVLRLILEYQHRLNNRASYQSTRIANQESRSAYASKKSSLWVNDIALTTGYRDFLEAYPEIQIPTSDLMNHMSISDIEHSNEKHVHSNGEVICPNA